MRQLRQLILLWLFVGASLLLGAGTAFAHNVLIGSEPANGSSVASGPNAVTLTYDLPVKQYFSAVSVVGPDGNHFEAGPAIVDGNSVRAPVLPLGPAGVYTVGYRIVSEDGHPVSGAVRFTLTQPGPGRGVPAQAAASQESSAPGAAGERTGTSATSGGGGVPAWPWVVGGVLLVAAGATVALRAGKGAGD